MASVLLVPSPSSCLISDLVAQAEAELASLGLAAIDEANDAVMLLSGPAIQAPQASSDAETESGDGSDTTVEGSNRELSPPNANLARPMSTKNAAPHHPAKRLKPRSSNVALNQEPEEVLSESSLSELSSDESVPSPATSKRTRSNRRRKASRKQKDAGKNSRRRALYQKAMQLETNLLQNSLPHSTQGYIGSESYSPQSIDDPCPYEGPLPQNVPYNAQPRLLDLCRQNYQVISFTYGPTLFLDASGRIIAWRVGSFGGESAYKRWEAYVSQLTVAVEKLASGIGRKKGRAGQPRGPHSWAHWGYSFGGGEQRPTSKQTSKRERDAWMEFMANPAYKNTLKLVKDSWETWAPDVFADYDDCHQGILADDDSLNCVYPKDSDIIVPFASITANLGPQTVCENHKDIKNKASGGICGVQALGPFDSKLGGHLILHELHIIVEMRPGDIIFFPSAVISHETIPISATEKRYSLVWYSAGGLFRWRDAAGRSLKEWAKKSPSEHKEHQNGGDRRWTEGWRNFSTPSDLMGRVSATSGLKNAPTNPT